MHNEKQINKELVDTQDLKSVFISHCKELGCDENYIKVCENKFSNIEIALKKIESPLTKEYLAYENKNLREKVDELIIEHKALEIIKKKKVNVGAFMKCCLSLSYEEYIKQWGNWHKHIFKNISGELLTQEEYGLLKEVLKGE